ncbi:MAG: hypothetical protein EXS36_17060 [Pedosphaera sp.]|nr:hypothetical protein [Pedosphaera sp.]
MNRKIYLERFDPSARTALAAVRQWPIVNCSPIQSQIIVVSAPEQHAPALKNARFHVQVDDSSYPNQPANAMFHHSPVLSYTIG